MSNLQIIKNYYNYINEGDFGEDTYFKLFAEQVEIFYPKFGFGYGREGIDNFTRQIRQVVSSLSFDLTKFNFIERDNYVVVEGYEVGQTTHGIDFPNHITSFGKFASVFELKDGQIIRMHSYVDPDLAGQDQVISRLFKEVLSEDTILTDQEVTKQVVEQFYDILLDKTQADILTLFADKVDWDIPGNTALFPWLGKRTTKVEIKEFFNTLRLYVKPGVFEIEFISVHGQNATAVGHLSSTIIESDQVFNSAFVAVFKVVNNRITKYHFLEDSYTLNELAK